MLRGLAALLPPLLWAGIVPSPSHGECVQVIGFEGKGIVLNPVLNGTPEDITWKKEGNIKYEWHKTNTDSNGSLILSELSFSDAGKYTAETLVGQDNELQFTCYRLIILESLRRPDLNCSVHNGSILVYCIAPQEICSHNLRVSYHWEDRGKVVHQTPSIQLQKNAELPEQITCVINIANVNSNNSIALSECSQKEEPQKRTRTIIISIAAVVVLLAAIAVALWKTGYLRRWTSQEPPVCPDEIQLQENQPLNELGGVLEKPEEARSEGTADANLLDERLLLNDSRCISENLEEKRREDVSEDQEPSLKEEDLSLSLAKPDSD